MTAPDSLEQVVEEMRLDAARYVHYTKGDLESVAARIEALIPSKAEREFLEASNRLAEVLDRIGLPHSSGVYADELAARMRVIRTAYRALLKERGKADASL